MSHRAFKNRLYAEFARIGTALASDKRLELLDLLAQAPRHVKGLASEMGLPMANVSQHLQVLRQARLVEAQRTGVKVQYRLAGEDVLRLWLALRTVAETRRAEISGWPASPRCWNQRTPPSRGKSGLNGRHAGMPSRSTCVRRWNTPTVTCPAQSPCPLRRFQRGLVSCQKSRRLWRTTVAPTASLPARPSPSFASTALTPSGWWEAGLNGRPRAGRLPQKPLDSCRRTGPAAPAGMMRDPACADTEVQARRGYDTPGSTGVAIPACASMTSPAARQMSSR